MRFLIDNNLSPLVAEGLLKAGHDAVHIRDYDMRAAPDAEVLDRADAENRVLISADTDFGTLLAQRRSGSPSLVLIRRLSGRRATEQVDIILANLESVIEDLEAGAVVVLGDEWLRVATSTTPSHSPLAADQPTPRRQSRQTCALTVLVGNIQSESIAQCPDISAVFAATKAPTQSCSPYPRSSRGPGICRPRKHASSSMISSTQRMTPQN